MVNGVPLVEGVLNGRFVPAGEFGAFAQSWNGMPVVLRHPKQNGGSARVPAPDVPEIGRFYNAAIDKNRLIGEFWLDKQTLEALPEGEVLIHKIMNAHPVEVSTGYFSESWPEAGKWNEKDYTLIDKNIKPDHIAILPDEIGACSIKDGCGMNRNQMQLNVTGSLPEAGKKMWEEIYQSALVQYKGDEEKAAAVAWAAVKKKYTKDGDEWVLRKNAISSDSLTAKMSRVHEAFERISQTPQQSENMTYSTYIREVYEDYVIIESMDGLYRANYSIDGEAVSFDPPADWTKVKIEYAPQQNESTALTDEDEQSLLAEWFKFVQN